MREMKSSLTDMSSSSEVSAEVQQTETVTNPSTSRDVEDTMLKEVRGK